MKWDLAILMKQALDEINKLAKFDDEEATRTLDDNTNEDRYLKNDLSSVNKIIVSDSISRSQFDKWKNIDELGRDGMYTLIPENHSISVKLKSDLDVDEYNSTGHARFAISYPVVNGDIKKTLGEVAIVGIGVSDEQRGKGIGVFIFILILYICYKRYGVKYFASHSLLTGMASVSPSASRVFRSLKSSGVIKPVRDTEYHSDYLHGIVNDDTRGRVALSLKEDNTWNWEKYDKPSNSQEVIDAIETYSLKTDRSVGDSDLYEINHIAIMNFFKSFEESHPHLVDENGKLDIEYQHSKLKL